MKITEVFNNVQFVVDSEGNRKSVMLDYQIWEQLTESQIYILDQNRQLKEEKERLESELNAVKQSNDNFLSEIDMLKRLRYAGKAEIRQDYESEISRLGDALASANQTFISVPQSIPKNFEGWTVNKNNLGYYRFFKKFSSNTMCAYIGKEWNENKARKAIADKLAKLANSAIQTRQKTHQPQNGNKH
jgi:hypothetical protein